MIYGRVLVTIVLLMSSITVFRASSVPNQLTTTTHYELTTTTFIERITSVITFLSSYTTTYSEVIRDHTGLFTMVPSTHTCGRGFWPFVAGPEGMRFVLNIESDQPINVNIMTANEFERTDIASNIGACARDSQSVLVLHDVTNLEQTFEAPDAETYYLVLSYYNHNDKTMVHFTLTRVALWPSTDEYYSTTVVYRSSTNVRTMTSSHMLEQNQTNQPLLLAVVTLVTIAALLLYARFQRKDKAKLTSNWKHCVNCRCKLPVDASFCDACGTRQTE